MVKSMTGFGRGEAMGVGKRFTIELKGVNHRYSEVVLRMPRSMATLEDRIRRQIQDSVARGRVDGYFTLENYGNKTPIVKVDKDLAVSYYKAMKSLQSDLGLSGEIEVKDLLNLPDILSVQEEPEDPETWWPFWEEALTRALTGMMEMRRVEGDRLQMDLVMRIERIARAAEEIKQRTPELANHYRERLTMRLQEWLEGNIMDQSRLEAEVVLFAEKSSITEELVRLNSHLVQARNCLEADEPVGRKLDFLLQEMHREINTIAAKAGDMLVGQQVINVKSELEKIREQVQNIE